ncbi:PaaI family thioesterase [Naumannella cuiyingiana]|uniref:Uncharacterized protein (TIGR00369 family) n=1 Tax=Naumannella cuiyingiana TaxID=1347891 RepID=A0A7Z0IJT1_9ACTN|nr:PaaI family thioesterase [Naumannella cuiyingiana]NYI69727.1 uncharacterized protein (TIGR00369 family) [Naumannella cuiyingiana]
MSNDAAALPSSEFLDLIGLEITENTGDRLAGHVDLGPQHHQPYGIVHGGVFCAIIETAASVGAATAVADQGLGVVGVHNATDFLRPGRAGRAQVVAEPLHRGRTQQLWQVIITDEASGKALARGQVRLHNISRDAVSP